MKLNKEEIEVTRRTNYEEALRKLWSEKVIFVKAKKTKYEGIVALLMQGQKHGH